MEKQYDVIALGELLIDFTKEGLSSQGNSLFEANPGGAPCNVLAMLTKLGKKSAFIGKVGDDMFGRQLKQVISDLGIGTSGLVMDNKVHTTLAFVQNFPNGDRDFSFFRNPGADMMLEKSEVPKELAGGGRIFHFGTLSMTHETVRDATKYAVFVAKRSGCIISFDPNLRPPLWESIEDAGTQMRWGLSQCDILKISDNELEFITGEKDVDKGAAVLKEEYPDIRLLNVTAGAEGSCSYYNGMRVLVPGYKLGGTVDTTGAGDTFCACVLNYILEHSLNSLKEENLLEMLKFANAAAYLVTTKKGAIRSMPDKESIIEIYNHTDI